MFNIASKKPSSYVINSVTIPICYRSKTHAKNIILRYDGKRGQLCITLPKFYRVQDIITLLEHNHIWLEQQYKRTNIPTVLETMQLPFLGRTLTIKHKEGRGLTYCNDDILYIFCQEAFITRRVTSYLQDYGRSYYHELLNQYYHNTPHYHPALHLKDTASSWGSCHPTRGIVINYRLLMAKPAINHYVMAHEIAHINHPNHSRQFWAHVKTLYPNYEQERAWLKNNGWRLHHIL